MDSDSKNSFYAVVFFLIGLFVIFIGIPIFSTIVEPYPSSIEKELDMKYIEIDKLSNHSWEICDVDSGACYIFTRVNPTLWPLFYTPGSESFLPKINSDGQVKILSEEEVEKLKEEHNFLKEE